MKVAALIFVCLIVCSCGAHPISKPVSKVGDYHAEVIQYEGRPLTCMVKHVSHGTTAWGGISCDWFAFHQDGTPGGFRQ